MTCCGTYTYSGGRVVEDEGELLDALIREFCWNESFCATEIIREDEDLAPDLLPFASVEVYQRHFP